MGRAKAVEADSASGSVTMRTYVGGSVEVSGFRIYQGQVFQVILTRRKKSQCGFQQLGESRRRKGCGSGKLKFVECRLCVRHLIRAFIQVVFFIFTARKTGKFYPYFICGETAHGHVVKWQEEIGTEVCSFHSTTVPASEDSIQH